MNRILIVEDNDEFAGLASESLNKYSLERAINYLDAMDKIKKESYDFHVIDGFFPYGTRVPENIVNLFSTEGALNAMPLEQQIEALVGEDSSNLPMGALLGRNLKQQGIESYLICSAAYHHSGSYRAISLLADKWGLNLKLNDENGKIALKSTKEYWADVRKIIERRD